MSFKKFLWLVGTDIQRYVEHNNESLTFIKKLSAFFMPSIMALFLARLSHYFWLHGWRLPARFIFMMNIIIFSCDISPASEIGPYFYMPHTVGAVIFGKIGERCTFYAQTCLGGRENDIRDVGAGPGLPCLGDRVTVGARSIVLGGFKIGSGSAIGAGCIVMKDIPENGVVVAVPPRLIKGNSIDV